MTTKEFAKILQDKLTSEYVLDSHQFIIRHFIERSRQPHGRQQRRLLFIKPFHPPLAPARIVGDILAL